MTFSRINEHTLRCEIHENEISQMGYNLQELLQNQDLVTNFLKDIMEKANEAGYSMTDNYKAIQSTFLPDHQIVLNIMDINMEEPMNEMIMNYLNVYDTVNLIGKERLEEMLNLTGDEKIQAFSECMAEIHRRNEASADTKDPDITQKETAPEPDLQDEKMPKKKYLLWFRSLGDTEQFCKGASVLVPGRLYKDRTRYCMLIDLSDMEQEAAKFFLLTAKEFTSDIRADHNHVAYLDEHAEIIIKENPMDVLRRL